ncbi:MAG TPA: DsbA family protein [Solirubrobacteraceae bacterium]|nr:DsbA family protein [Solirubrobacteraceae bacterium]
MPLTVPPSFFFGAMSPYSWFAAERIERLLPQARWHGVLAGAIFTQHGRVSWGLDERRADGIADCEQRAAQYALGPIEWPAEWPTSDLLVARAMVFCEQPAAAGRGAARDARGMRSGDRLLRSFALATMRLAFLEGADLAETDAVLEAGRRAGIDEHRLREALRDPHIKDALRLATDEALAAGVFGVPTVLVGAELFWGDDRLSDAAAAYRSSQAA